MDTRPFSIIFDVCSPPLGREECGCLCYGSVESLGEEALGASIIRVSAAAVEDWGLKFQTRGAPRRGQDWMIAGVEWIGWREESGALILAMDMAEGLEDRTGLGGEILRAIEAEMARRGARLLGRREGSDLEVQAVARMARSQHLDAASALAPIEAWMMELASREAIAAERGEMRE